MQKSKILPTSSAGTKLALILLRQVGIKGQKFGVICLVGWHFLLLGIRKQVIKMDTAVGEWVESALGKPKRNRSQVAQKRNPSTS